MTRELSSSLADRSAARPVGGRVAGLERLEAFLPLVGEYARTRNDTAPRRGGVSGLSPYLRSRLLLEEEVVRAVSGADPGAGQRKFIEEVVWRTYWKGWLEMRPRVWIRYRREVERLLAEIDNGARERYRQTIGGESSLACMSAWTRELVDTGYLHNHVRMWYASIWVHTLRLPWELGADFFLRHLLDGDPASNTLSWRWVAGLHTRGKQYVAQATNIRKHTHGRFDPERLSANPPPPEFVPEPAAPLSPLEPFGGASLPSLSSSPCGLLVTAEDLVPDIGPLAGCPFSSIALFNAAEADADLRLSERVRGFRDEAAADSAARLAAHWGGELVRVGHDNELAFRAEAAPGSYVSRPTSMRIYCGAVDSWTTAVRRWAEREHLSAVRVLQPPVGPLRERMPRLRVELRRAGVRLIEHRREWDDLHWPHCARGYFAFRKGLPERLKQLGIAYP
ncbi:MAG: hypothetical protein JJU00_18405 [Opitutales bacterium]|nr:hypothetical protein [Opitutales bacterium]